MEKYYNDITLWRLINRFLTYEEKYHLSNRKFACKHASLMQHNNRKLLRVQKFIFEQFFKSCLKLREVQNYLAGEEFEHLRNKLESDRICNRGFWQKNVQQENRFFRVLDLLIYLGKIHQLY